MSDHRFSRRRILKDLGLGAAVLPLLDMGKSAWGATTAPRRLMLISWTNGAVGVWPREYSKTDETMFTLPETLSAFEPHKKDIILVGGMDLKSARDDGAAAGTGDLHHTMPHLLTGVKSIPGIANGKPDGNLARGGGISVDQFVADAQMRRAPTPIRSLEMGLWKNPSSVGHRFFSFREAGTGNLPEIDPMKVYARVFGAGLPTSGGATSNIDRLTQIRRERKSLFDFVRTELGALERRLSSEDRLKVQRHATSVRELETELDQLQPAASPGKCGEPAGADAAVNVKKMTDVPRVMKLHIDIALAAMSCNITRVATIAMGDGGNDELTFPWLGVDFRGGGDEYSVRSHHDVAHRSYDSPEHTRRKILVDQWHYAQLAYAIGRMKQLPEGGGTMLDSSLLGIFNTGSEGRSHAIDRLPWVIAGRAGGYFKTGRYYKAGDWAQTAYDRSSKLVPHNGLLVAIANAMEAPTETFGDAKYGGELAGLRG